MEVVSVVFSLGSNLGDRIQILEDAISMINTEIGQVIKKSGFYESKSWGYDSKNQFINCCIECLTLFNSQEVLNKTQRIERKFGRTKSQNYNDRTLDIDIVFYDDLILRTNSLTIPHPLINSRLFVLMPLVKILPERTHPVTKLTVRQHLENCISKEEIFVYN